MSVYEKNHAFLSIFCFCNAFLMKHNADFTWKRVGLLQK